MTANVLRAEEQAAPYLVAPLLTDQLDSFASAPEGFKRLRELVLNLAVRGRLVPQDSTDDPAECLIHKKRTRIDREQQSPFSQLPLGWTFVSLSELGDFSGGKTPSTNNSAYWDGVIPWVTPKDMKLSEILDTQDHVSELALRDGLNQIEAGSVLIVVRSGILRRMLPVAIARTRCTVNQDLKALRLARPEMAAFVRLLLLGHERWILENLTKTGTTVESVKFDELAECPFPLPPLAEQSRIVAKVEELMALIDALEAKVGAGGTAQGKLLDTLLAALADSPDAAATAEAWAQLAPRFDLLLQTPADVDRLQQTLLALAVKGRLVPQDPKDEPAAELLKRIRIEKARLVAEGRIKQDKPQAAIADDEQPFHPPNGWEWVRFGDIHQVAGGVTLGRKLTGKRTVSHPYLRVANVQRGALDLRQIKEVEIAEEELDRYRLRRDDLLITEGGDWDKVGRTAIWRGEIEPCLHQNHIFRARRITSDMNVEWVALFMNSAIAMAYFQASAKQTTNLASINMGELKHCAIPIPPLPEQSRIVAAVASLTALCDRLRERLATRRALSATLAAALTESALA